MLDAGGAHINEKAGDGFRFFILKKIGFLIFFFKDC